jgi:hypothetical protein
MFLALSKLTRFPVFYGDLQWTQDITNKPCLLKDMKMLPGVTFLNLAVISNGHAFGASVFHVLRLCSGTRKLTLHTSGGNSLEVKLYVFFRKGGKVICCLYICICISRYWLHAYTFAAMFIWNYMVYLCPIVMALCSTFGF